MKSNEPTKRAIETCHHFEVKRDGNELFIQFHGRNKADQMTIFKIRIQWWLWPYMVREMAKAWIQERQNRIAEIQRVNGSFVDTLQKQESEQPK